MFLKKIFAKNLLGFIESSTYLKRNKSKLICCCCRKTNTPHPTRDPPEQYNPQTFNSCAFEPPENVQLLVFRPLKENDVLGPNAAKDQTYKNPEYFAYHRFTHADLLMNAMRIRMEKRMAQMCPQPKEGESLKDVVTKVCGPAKKEEEVKAKPQPEKESVKIPVEEKKKEPPQVKVCVKPEELEQGPVVFTAKRARPKESKAEKPTDSKTCKPAGSVKDYDVDVFKRMVGSRSRARCGIKYKQKSSEIVKDKGPDKVKAEMAIKPSQRFVCKEVKCQVAPKPVNAEKGASEPTSELDKCIHCKPSMSLEISQSGSMPCESKKADECQAAGKPSELEKAGKAQAAAKSCELKKADECQAALKPCEPKKADECEAAGKPSELEKAGKAQAAAKSCELKKADECQAALKPCEPKKADECQAAPKPCESKKADECKATSKPCEMEKADKCQADPKPCEPTKAKTDVKGECNCDNPNCPNRSGDGKKCG